MATKGVPLDLNKKYKMQNGTKVKNLVLRCEQDKCVSWDYPIKAYFIDNNGIEFCLHYTLDGFYNKNKDDDERNLILDEETNAAEIINDNINLIAIESILNCVLNNYLNSINKTSQNIVIKNITICIKQLLTLIKEELNNGD